MLEGGVLYKFVERRILVESLGVLLGTKSVIKPTGVIRRELGSHVSGSSRVLISTFSLSRRSSTDWKRVSSPVWLPQPSPVVSVDLAVSRRIPKKESESLRLNRHFEEHLEEGP